MKKDYTKEVKDAIVLVLEELAHRLPKTAKEGFLLDPEVEEAVKTLDKFVGKK